MVRVPMTTEAETDPLVDRLILLALGACAVTVLSGGACALAYLDDGALLARSGLTLQHVRPIHDSAAFGWVFLGGVSIVYDHLRRTHGPFTPKVRMRIALHIGLWTAAGIGIVGSLLAGRFTGREYAGYHPAFSLMILAGWLLFAANWFGRTGFTLRDRPVQVHMWSVAIVLFIAAYAEAHLYLLEGVSRRPLRDLAIQWKSAGVLVGSFNLLAYGGLLHISERLHGDRGYSRSPTAFALFWVGLLNTFANYGHHTYHLPQSRWIHWIACGVSLLEVILLAKVGTDLVGLRRRPQPPPGGETVEAFLRSTILWTFALLLLAILISIPPLNTMIHGTHVVVAHAMGSMIGIDSMILWAGISLLIGGPGLRIRRAIAPLHVAVALFLAAFLVRGAAAGWSRYAGASSPDISRLVQVFPFAMAAAGLAIEFLVLWMIGHWVFALVRGRPFRSAPRRTGRPAARA